TSSTGRTPPPAMTPVPGEAGFRSTSAAPKMPMISCGIVPFTSGILNRFRFARSVPLRIASGTSFALPRPAPTWPCWSPTTTSAENENRRPPLTTFATRLMWTTRSTSSPTSSGLMSMCWFLELESRFAGSVGDFLDATVEDEAVAIEHDGGDLERDQLLADRLADHASALLLRLAVHRSRQLLLGVRGSREHATRDVVDRLRVDVLRRAEHGQTRTLRGAVDPLADGALALRALALFGGAVLDVSSHGYLPAVFPALRRMVSVTYLMPLPLYGSGGRKLRIFADAAPSSWRSMPDKINRFLSVFAEMPSGSV